MLSRSEIFVNNHPGVLKGTSDRTITLNNNFFFLHFGLLNTDYSNFQLKYFSWSGHSKVMPRAWRRPKVPEMLTHNATILYH